MKIIDGSKSLTSGLIQEFANYLTNEDKIAFNCESNIIKYTSVETIGNDILTNGLDDSQIKDSMIFSLITENVMLTFNGVDYKWWKKTSKRISKFQSIICYKDINNEQKYTVAVAYCIDNYLSNIQWFSGQKSKAIDFINDDIFKKISSTSITTKVVINLAFDKDEFCNAVNGTEEQKQAYFQNIKMWYTVNELEEIGAITVK